MNIPQITTSTRESLRKKTYLVFLRYPYIPSFINNKRDANISEIDV